MSSRRCMTSVFLSLSLATVISISQSAQADITLGNKTTVKIVSGQLVVANSKGVKLNSVSVDQHLKRVGDQLKAQVSLEHAIDIGRGYVVVAGTMTHEKWSKPFLIRIAMTEDRVGLDKAFAARKNSIPGIGFAAEYSYPVEVVGLTQLENSDFLVIGNHKDSSDLGAVLVQRFNKDGFTPKWQPVDTTDTPSSSGLYNFTEGRAHEYQGLTQSEGEIFLHFAEKKRRLLVGSKTLIKTLKFDLETGILMPESLVSKRKFAKQQKVNLCRQNLKS